MSETKHTPGPIYVEKCPCGSPSCELYQLSSGSFYVGSGFRKVDAQLYAAAPDMYEALEKIVEMNRDYMLHKCGNPDEAETMSCVVVARAALSKARGDSQ